MSMPMPIRRKKKATRLRTTAMKRPLKGHRGGRWTKSVAEFSTARPKGFINQSIHDKKAIPGSSHYRPMDIRVQKGMKFSNAFPKNDVDWKVYAAKKIPGPGHYRQTPSKVHQFTVGHSGKFNNSMPATDVDIAMRRSRQEPGPLEYCTSFNKRKAGGRAFSTSNLPTFSDIEKNYTVDNPGPGHYKQDVVKRKRKSTTGQFSTSNVPGYIQVNLRHYGANPSPAAYQHHNFDHAIRERYGTSKMSTSNAKSDVDWKIYRASSIPGPGQYNPSQTFGSDVMHHYGGGSGRGCDTSREQIRTPATPLHVKAPLKCYDGNVMVRQEFVDLFKLSGVLSLIRSFRKSQMKSVVSMVEKYPLPLQMNRKGCKKHLEQVLQKHRERCGNGSSTSIPMIKLIGSMLKHDGQLERAIGIMKSAVNCSM